MPYHDLSKSTLTPEERVAEKNRIVSRLEDVYLKLTQTEAEFVTRIGLSNFVSVKQLFWLRDINNKY